MNKRQVYITLKVIRENIEPGGSLTKDISHILSLVEQEYIKCDRIFLDFKPYKASGIFITNKGHDFISYAETLNNSGVDISQMSYEDIEHFGRAELLSQLGLE